MLIVATTEPNLAESTRAEIGMARALLDAMVPTEIIDLRPTGLTIVELLDALVVTGLQLVRDPHSIAAEALAEALADVPLVTTS
jgi:hypothetical protein